MTTYEVRYGGGIADARRFTADQYNDAVVLFAQVVCALGASPQKTAAWASLSQRDGELGRTLTAWTKIERPAVEGESI